MDINNACAFTGHRPAHFNFKYDETHPDCIILKQRMKFEILLLIEKGVNTFFSGMALGIDIWGAELVLELREQYDLKLIAALPCETQADRWSIPQRDRYFNTLPLCDDVIYISHHYTPSCMHQRNRYMVDHAQHLLAVFDGGETGGTAYTVNYARSKGRNIIIIPSDGNPKIVRFREI